MSAGPLEILGIIAALLVGAVAIGLIVVLAIKFIGLLVRLIGHVFATIGRWIGDVFRLIGALVVAVVFVPLILLNIVIGRWSASAHYGRALTDECKTMGACIYRIALGHPLHLIGLRGLTEGIEQRLPNAVAYAPGPDKPSKKRQGLFDGFTIVGSLPGGGSGGKLYVAEPDELKRAAFARRGHADVDRVVIKTFSLTDGSSLPQIVRESRALDAAKKLGLVLEHELTDERFYYIMRYVPGDSLTVTTQNLHAKAGTAGLDAGGIRLAVGYTADLLESLDIYHRGGLWHKDVKPDNLIVDREADPALGRGKAHLVDFGLITPLRSAMTLTTHGTEYFRDPELVRQALRGVKVHQIDGGRFDVYAAGAVLFSIVENSFPAHGGLSQVSKNCPEALRWIIRRAMTDYDKRYPTARAMLDDLTVLAAAGDPFAVKPADLPSMSGKTPEPAPAPVAVEFPDVAATPEQPPALVQAAASPVPPPSPAPAAAAAAIPRLRVSDWWTGRYTPSGAARDAAPRPANAPGVAPKFKAPKGFVFHADIGKGQPARPLTPPEQRLSAKDQVKHAQQRAADRRARVGTHRPRPGKAGHAAMGPTSRAGRRRGKSPSAINAGIVLALMFLVSEAGVFVIAFGLQSTRSAGSTAITQTIVTPDGVEHTIAAPTPPDVPAFSYDFKEGFNDSFAEEISAAIAEAIDEATAQAAEAHASEDPASSPVYGMVPTPDDTTDGLDIAILTDFRPPFAPEMVEDFRLASDTLAECGAHAATSLFTGKPASEGDATTLAKLLKIRGQAILDAELGAELNDYLYTNKSLDTVWWIGPGDNQTYRYLLVADSGINVFETDDPRLAEVTAALLDKLGYDEDCTP